jgi:hypothetical protein
VHQLAVLAVVVVADVSCSTIAVPSMS